MGLLHLISRLYAVICIKRASSLAGKRIRSSAACYPLDQGNKLPVIFRPPQIKALVQAIGIKGFVRLTAPGKTLFLPVGREKQGKFRSLYPSPIKMRLSEKVGPSARYPQGGLDKGWDKVCVR